MVDAPSRIAVVTHGLGVGGGVPTVARWLADGFSRLGATVDLHDLATARSDDVSLRLASPKTWRCNPTQRPTGEARPGLHWGALAVELEFMRYAPRAALIRCLDGYDTIQVVSGTPAWAVAVRGTQKPVALQVATTALWERSARWPTMRPARAIYSRASTQVTRALDRVGCQGVDHVMVENPAMQGQVRAWGQDSVTICPPGVEVSEFRPLPTGRPKGGPIISVGRLGEERKRFDRVIASYAHARTLSSNLPPLRLVGKGILPAPLWARIRLLGIEPFVTVDADLPITEVRLALQQASVFLQASSEEGLGIAVLEAMASGLPVVATETHGTRESVVDRLTGRLVAQTPTVVEDLAKALLEVWQGDAQGMGTRGRARAIASFSSEAALARFWNIHMDLYSTYRTRR